MQNTRIDISPGNWEIVRDILQKHVPQYEVCAFGSRATWTAKEYSDLDLVVMTDKSLSLSVSAELAEDFSESDLPWKVDVVDWATTSEVFRRIIEKDKVVLQKGGEIEKKRRGSGVSSDWGKACVGDFVELQRGNSYKSKLLDLPGPYLLGLASIEREGGFRNEKLRTYGGPTADKLLLYPGDIYVSLKDVTQSGDLLGSVARVPKEIEVGRVTQDTVKLVFTNGLISKTYLYWILRSPQYKSYCRARGMGTTNLSLSRVDFLSFPIPEINETREKLVNILEAIEEKIALNHRINQTLEQIAQAIFKSWFVDLEPVKAKIQAKQEWEAKSLTAMDGGNDENAGAIFVERAAMRAIAGAVQGCTNAAGAGCAGATDAFLETSTPEQRQQLIATAALFPDELEETELGPIPRGWKAKPLSKMIEIIGGGTPKKSEPAYWGGDIPWFSVRDAPADGDVFVIDTAEKITGAGLNRSSTRLLPEGVTIISARGTVGRLAVVGVPMAMNQSCYGLKGKGCIGRSFNYFNLKHAVSTLKRQTHGAVFDTITTKTFDTVFSVEPEENLLNEFEKEVFPLFERIRSGLTENMYLASMRDSILPKLLSGEITLTDAESQARYVG